MIPEIIGCLNHAMAFMRDQVSDLTGGDLLLQPPGAPNNPAWTLGHTIFSLQEMAVEIGSEPWLPAEWESRFGYGSRPVPPPGSEPPAASALLDALADAGARLEAALLAAGEASLAAPCPDPETRTTFPTRGAILIQVVVGHTAFHAGQLAAWRRAAGRAPRGVFV